MAYGNGKYNFADDSTAFHIKALADEQTDNTTDKKNDGTNRNSTKDRGKSCDFKGGVCKKCGRKK